MTIGIYALKWEKENLWYIGQSSRIEERFKDHIRDMRNGTHCNYKIIQAYKAYGVPEIVILEECSLLELNDKEFVYINEFDTFNNGLNLSIGPQKYLCGENHPNSIYSNEKIEQAFLLLVERNLTHNEISKITGLTKDTIKSISCGKNHNWLKEIYPDKYETLLKTKKSEHNSGEQHNCAIHTNEKIISVFLKYLVNRPLPLKTVSKLVNIHHSTLSNIVSGLQHKWLKEKYQEEYEIMRNNSLKRRK